MNQQLAGLIEEAFDYHSYGWKAVKASGDYALGPTFAAYCPEFVPRERASIYTEGEDLRDRMVAAVLASILSQAPEPDPDLTVSKEAHKRFRTQNNCKARTLVMGGYEADVELAYPLYKLMRFYKPTGFGFTSEGGVLYAFDDDRVVFAARTRQRVLNCMEEMEE